MTEAQRSTRLTRIRFGLRRLQPYGVVGGPADAEPFLYSFFPASEISGMIADLILPEGTAIVGCLDGERLVVQLHWKGDAWARAVRVERFEDPRVEARAKRMVEVEYPDHMEGRRLLSKNSARRPAEMDGDWYKQGRLATRWKEHAGIRSI